MSWSGAGAGAGAGSGVQHHHTLSPSVPATHTRTNTHTRRELTRLYTPVSISLDLRDSEVLAICEEAIAIVGARDCLVYIQTNIAEQARPLNK